MVNSNTNWHFLYLQFQQDCHSQYPEKQAKQKISEMDSALIRIVLPLMGYTGKPKGRYLTAEDKQAAFEFMKTLPLKKLPEGLRLLEEKGHTLPLTKSSLNTYGARARQWFGWVKDNDFWPFYRYKSSEIESQCAPKAGHGFRNGDAVHLTDRRFQYPEYAINFNEESDDLRRWKQQAFEFLTAPEHPQRVTGAISEESADTFFRNIARMLGFLKNYLGVPSEDLSLDLIFPKVSRAGLKQMTPEEQEEFWQEKQQALKTLLCEHRAFMRQEMVSNSPHTWKGRLSAVQALGRIQYADWVTVEDDYRSIPLFKTLSPFFDSVSKEIDEWEFNIDLMDKWPDVPEGSTALEEFQKHVVEVLRQECRPRDYRGALRKPKRFALKQQHFLKAGLIGLVAPRRQQDDRSTKIALSCPIKRPEYVPADGLYYPLPPNKLREKDRTGKIVDNYIYRTYKFKGRLYPDGVWIRDIRGYKTRKTHGVFEVILPNREFEDGRCFYDYLEEYLGGVWLPGPFRNRKPYAWWDKAYQGLSGKWVTPGRSIFNPKDVEGQDLTGTTWRWGYLFIGPKTGLPFDHKGYANSIRTNSFRLIGKKITPHILRYMWATWAIQVGLSDAELRSLAFMMGHSPDTLRRMYEKCTPSEKQVHIENAITARLCRPLGSLPDGQVLGVEGITQAMRALSQAELFQLFQYLQGRLDRPSA